MKKISVYFQTHQHSKIFSTIFFLHLQYIFASWLRRCTYSIGKCEWKKIETKNDIWIVNTDDSPTLFSQGKKEKNGAISLEQGGARCLWRWWGVTGLLWPKIHIFFLANLYMLMRRNNSNISPSSKCKIIKRKIIRNLNRKKNYIFFPSKYGNYIAAYDICMKAILNE